VNLWHIHEDHFDPKKLHSQETVYTIGNGYFGTRGTFEEGYIGAKPATLLFGVFDALSIGKEELANAPDWLLIKLFVNHERFRLTKGKVLDYQRTLDMRHGILSRTVRWESPSGIRLKIHSERFASLADEHVGAIRYSVTVEEKPNEIKNLHLVLRGIINTAVGNDDLMHWESIEEGHQDDVIWLQSKTRHADVLLAQTMSFQTSAPGFSKESLDSDIAPVSILEGNLEVGQTVTAEKIVTMFTSRDTDKPVHTALREHLRLLHTPSDTGTSLYETLLAKNNAAWDEHWKRSDIVIEGDDTSQQAIRYNIYQLRISASSHDSRYSVAAKGLTGFGYRGHIFHDTEIFMLPYYTYVLPEIARNLLLYRYHLLPAAREKARQNGYAGAQYPWESTLDGQEATPDAIIHPESKELIPVLNGRIELHITASIAYAVNQYWQVTGDDEFMRDYGAEILLSTAEFWVSRAERHPDRGDYEINDVVGPDEWHEHVNNNAYTNYMAMVNIQDALSVLYWLQNEFPDKAEALLKKLNLSTSRLGLWQDVTEHIRIPQDKDTGVFEQFDGFFKLGRLEQGAFKDRKMSYQALLGMTEVQRYQIIKQADVLMLLTLLRDRFDLKTKQANWKYYYPITDHDYGSSLTPALHTILACELNLVDIAYEMFLKGALVDLKDLRGNTSEGIHDACCGAVWQAVIFGFAGLSLTDEGHTTSPTWPDGWTRLAFTFMHKGRPVFVDLRK
jgi:trehalose/maltose hydrolase-like predicted phosphorylase